MTLKLLETAEETEEDIVAKAWVKAQRKIREGRIPTFSEKHMLVAVFLAEGKRPTDIAKETNVPTQQVHRLMRDEAFMAQVDAIKLEFASHIKSIGIANQEIRIQAIHDRWLRMRELVEHRALVGEERARRGVAAPGEETGLLAEFPVGRTTAMMFDGQLAKEMRETEKQIAQELGQWTNKVDVTSNGQSIQFTIPLGDNDLVDLDVRDNDDGRGVGQLDDEVFVLELWEEENEATS